jgi:prepilin signal peptidase PulO-like enzyme (type II secretory pathway)
MQIISNAHFYFLVLMAFLLGASIGSFLNVCILRIPRKISLSIPGSHCFQCGTTLGLGENIPIIGYFILKGKCKHCSSTFSFQYAWVEIVTAIFSVLFFICSIQSATSFNPLTWAFLLTFFSVLLVAAMIDLKWEIIPDQITLPLAIVFIVAHFFTPTSFLPIITEKNYIVNQPVIFIGLLAIFILYFIYTHLEPTRNNTNFFNLFLLVLLFSALLFYSVIKKDNSPEYAAAIYSLTGAIFTGGILYLILILFKLISKMEFLGEGDIKLLFVVGAFVGGMAAYKILIIWLYIAASFASILIFFQILKQKINQTEKYVGGAFLFVMICGLVIVTYVQIYYFNVTLFIIGIGLFLPASFGYFLFAKKMVRFENSLKRVSHGSIYWYSGITLFFLYT